MQAIMDKAGIETKAQAIVFSLPVTSTAGMRLMEEAKELLYEALDKCLSNRSADWSRIKGVIRDTMSEFLWKRTKRNPMILPIINEV